jgi:hypothetical protein
MTLRPQNRCADCGHHWYPRGNHVSRKCPDCQSPAVRIVIEDRQDVPRAALAPPPPSRLRFGRLAIGLTGVACVLVLGCCLFSTSFPRSGRAKPDKAVKSKPDKQPRGGDGEPFHPKHNPTEKKKEEKKASSVGQLVRAELLDAPDVEVPVAEVMLHPKTFAAGQIGSFKTGFGGAAQHATVVRIVSPSSVVVKALDDQFMLSGINTGNLVEDKAVYLRGKWEVVGLTGTSIKDVYELTYLTEASHMAEQEKASVEKANKPKLPSSTIDPIVPSYALVKSKGSVQVSGHYRSNGTYVAPYTRSAPGGRR